MNRIFDAAKWSTDDIEEKIEEANIALNDEERLSFIGEVINSLEQGFDASIGINWTVIENTIETLRCEYES